MNKIQKGIVKGSCGREMSVDITYPTENHKNLPVVIFSHGFKGFKDWGHFNLIAQEFANQGFVFVKFNYSHNGVTPEKQTEFVDLKAFGDNTYSKEVVDLKIMVDYVSEEPSLEGLIDKNKLFLIGHSKGGGNSILVASLDQRIKKICTWASVSRFGRMFNNEHFMDKWKEDGVVYILNNRTKESMPLFYNFYEDYVLNKQNLDVLKAAELINIPWLIIHGRKDFVVTLKEGKLLSSLNTKANLITNDGDHAFGGAHPWLEESLPSLAAEVIEQTIRFFKE